MASKKLTLDELYEKHRPRMYRRPVPIGATPQWRVPSETMQGRFYEWVEPIEAICPCPARTCLCWHVRAARRAEEDYWRVDSPQGAAAAYLHEQARRRGRRIFFTAEEVMRHVARWESSPP